MKKSLKNKNNLINKIPKKKSLNKFSLNLSLNGTNKLIGKNKNDTINKETVDGSNADSQTNYLNRESSNNLKVNYCKNPSNGKTNSQLFMYTSSFNEKKKMSNYLNNTKNHSEMENVPNKEEEIIPGENSEYTEEKTNKIDYRYYPNIPEIEANENIKKYYWLATYDKLMKETKIAKILNYYYDTLSQKETENYAENSDYKEDGYENKLKLMKEKYNFIEKTMIIEGYEIYFVKKHGKPFVRQKKGEKLFIKLYLLTLEQINQIFSYINRLEYKIYINDKDFNIEKNSFKIINTLNKTIYNYSKVFFLGTFMNIKIFLFSHKTKSDSSGNNNDNSINTVNDLPPSFKIAKIIKELMINFPDFSKKYFIDYLMKSKDNNNDKSIHEKELLTRKMNEVSSLLLTNDKNNHNSNLNNLNIEIRNIVNGIPTYTPSSLEDINKINDISSSFKDTSIKKYKEKIVLNNHNEYNEAICSDFLSNIKNEIKTISKESKEKKSYRKSNDSKKKESYRTKSSNKIKIKNSNNKSSKTRNGWSMKTIDNLGEDTVIFKTTSIKNKRKKNMTRDNSLNDNIIKKSKKKFDSCKNDSKIVYEENLKINNKKILDINLNKRKNKKIINDRKNITYDINNVNKNIEKEFAIRSSRNNLKINKIKSNSNSRTYKTICINTNSLNADIKSVKMENIKTKRGLKILPTMKKIISQKMNKILDDKNTNIGIENQSNNAISINYIKKNDLHIENSNNPIKSLKYNTIETKINDDLENKNNEYITPLKKKFFYYYK